MARMMLCELRPRGVT